LLFFFGGGDILNPGISKTVGDVKTSLQVNYCKLKDLHDAVRVSDISRDFLDISKKRSVLKTMFPRKTHASVEEIRKLTQV